MLPLRKPAFLTLGRKDRAARLYLKEKGQKGFTAITARREGIWGNEIAVTAQPAGPAMFDVSIIYKGDCFECAREIVLGREIGTTQACRKGTQKHSEKAALQEGMPALVKELLRPGTMGVLQAKAAGIRADVARDRT
jgi:predicted Zn-dependent protease